MKKKKGISLIVLIVTIIVIIILAAVVILTVSKNNPIESAREAIFKEDVRSFQDDLALTISKEYTKKQGQRDEKITTNDFEKIEEYIPSFTEKYKDKFVIENDKLVGTDKLTEKEKEWTEDLQVNASGKAPFNAEEWDQTATSEDCFYWEGTTITGFIPEKLSGVTKVRIPSKCKAIRSDYAWKGSEDYRNFVGGITSIELPDTVTEIGSYAFHNFLELTNIKLSSNITSFGEQAFNRCGKLTNVDMSDSVISIMIGAFSDCTSLKSIKISNNLTSIPSGVFSGCSSLTNITIPKNISYIGSSAFNGCSSLTSIIIPSSVTSMEEYPFNNCSSLTNINFEGTISQWNNISKLGDWYSGSAITSVICTDGTITL